MWSRLAPGIIYLTIFILSGVINTSACLTGIASMDASLVMRGEVWRVFTGHLTHLNWMHYALDAPIFCFVFLVYERNAGGFNSIYLTVFSAITVSSAVIIMGIHQVYAGLSGLTCAGIAAVLLKMVMDPPRRILPYMLAIAFLVYLLFLQETGNGLNVAKEAHVAGTLSGLIYEFIRQQTCASTSKA